MTTLTDEGYVITGREHTSVRLTRRCVDARPHRYDADNRCRCGDFRGEVRNCWFFNCGPDADEWHERWIVDIPSTWELLRGEQVSQ